LSEDPSVSVLLIEAGASNQAFRVKSPLTLLAEGQVLRRFEFHQLHGLCAR